MLFWVFAAKFEHFEVSQPRAAASEGRITSVFLKVFGLFPGNRGSEVTARGILVLSVGSGECPEVF